jgi:hypothetical protein
MSTDKVAFEVVVLQDVSTKCNIVVEVQLLPEVTKGSRDPFGVPSDVRKCNLKIITVEFNKKYT